LRAERNDNMFVSKTFEREIRETGIGETFCTTRIGTKYVYSRVHLKYLLAVDFVSLRKYVDVWWFCVFTDQKSSIILFTGLPRSQGTDVGDRSSPIHQTTKFSTMGYIKKKNYKLLIE